MRKIRKNIKTSCPTCGKIYSNKIQNSRRKELIILRLINLVSEENIKLIEYKNLKRENKLLEIQKAELIFQANKITKENIKLRREQEALRKLLENYLK
jgi:hypothetical protein